MKLKKILLIMLLLLIIIFVYATETRLEGMSGISETGLFIVPDLWCDTFYVNPAYASQNKNLYINWDNSFQLGNNSLENDEEFISIGINYIKTKYNKADQEFHPDFSFGMLFPVEKFTFGYRVNFDFTISNSNISQDYTDELNSCYSSENLIINSTLDNTFINSNYLSGEILFTWQVNKYLDFGVSTGITSVLLNTIKEDNAIEHNDNAINEKKIENYLRFTEHPLDLVIKNTLGLYLNKEKLNFSLSIPINIHLNKYLYYHKDKKYYENSSKSEYDYTGKYRNDTLSAGFSIVSVFDINVSKIVSFRIPIDAGFKYEIETEKEWYENNFLVINNNMNYYFEEYHGYFKFAFASINTINDKVLLFYGSDFYLLLTNELSHDLNPTIYSNWEWQRFTVDLNLGIFTGGEFQILKWLHLRAGMKTIFFHYLNSGNDEYNYTSTARKSTYSFLLNTSFSLGITFKPKEWMSLELNSNFITQALSKTSSSINNEQNEYSISFDFGLVFDVDYRKYINGSVENNFSDTGDTDSAISE